MATKQSKASAAAVEAEIGGVTFRAQIGRPATPDELVKAQAREAGRG